MNQCMRSELPINIQPTGTTPRIQFEPLSLSVSIGNQQKLFWSNNDSEPHWPVTQNCEDSRNSNHSTGQCVLMEAFSVVHWTS